MALAGHSGNRHKPARITLEFNLWLGGGQIVKIHSTAHVADAGGGAQHHGLLQLAGKAKGLAGHVLGFLRGGRLKTGQQGKARIGAVVLLVLARVTAWVVSRQQDHAAGQARVNGGEQRVGGHVDAHVLHGHEAHGAAKGGTGGHFHSHLLVDGIFQPVAALAAKAVERVRHFRRRSARVTTDHMHTRFKRAAHNGFVSQQQVPLAASALQQRMIAHVPSRPRHIA